MILSVSRRTDIPAFFAPWFMNRVKSGYVYVRNPFNFYQVSDIPLSPDIVDCIVFWTKNPLPLINYLPEISSLYSGNFYFQFTVNGYGREIEPAVPELGKRLDCFKKITQDYGRLKNVLRYDPIFINDKYTIEWHINKFGEIFNELKDYTDTCVISFVDMYTKTKSNTKEFGMRDLNVEEMEIIACEFSEIAANSNVTLKSCAEGIDLDKYGICHNSCIDKDRIEQIIGYQLKAKGDRQREYCRCIECADIGQYNTCKHGCRYCFANFNADKVSKAVMEHRAESPFLIGESDDRDIVKKYAKGVSLKGKSLNIEQLSLL